MAEERHRRFGIWTDEENRYLLAHAPDGVALLALSLNRTERDVKARAEQMGVRLRARPVVGLELCPACGEFYVYPSTAAGRMGLCSRCWMERKRAALAERAAYLEANRAYDREKKRLRQVRKSAAGAEK